MTNKADYVGSGGKGKGELSVPVAYYVGQQSLCQKKLQGLELFMKMKT